MPIKVLHLLSNKGGGIGGAEKFLLDMSPEYDFDKFSISYCTVFNDGENIYLDKLRKQGFECFDIKGSTLAGIPQIVSQLVNLMKREKFDIVHTQLLHGSIVGQLAARFAKVPVRIITRQYTTDCYHEGHKYVAGLDTFVAKKAHKIIAISEAVRDDLIENGVEAEKIDLIYNGIDLTPFQNSDTPSDIRKKYPNKFLIGFVANLNYRKGHEYLLRAIAILKKDFNDIHLVLLGEGDLREKLENLTVELDIEDNVSFMGYQSNVPEILKELDLYVHASTLEPLGIAVLEAMAAGRCVVATAVGGVPEIIEDGKTGFLIPPSNEEAIASAVRKVRNDSETVSKIGKAGRKHVEKTFDIKRIAEKYQELYYELLSRK